MEKFILTTPEELGNLIQFNIRQALRELEQSPKQEQDKLLTIQEAATFLNLAKQTIYGFTSNNLIPHIKRSHSKKLYFRKSDLEKWLLEGRRKTRSEIESTGTI